MGGRSDKGREKGDLWNRPCIAVRISGGNAKVREGEWVRRCDKGRKKEVKGVWRKFG